MVSNEEMSRRGSAPGRGAGNWGELEFYRGATHEFSALKTILQSLQRLVKRLVCQHKRTAELTPPRDPRLSKYAAVIINCGENDYCADCGVRL